MSELLQPLAELGAALTEFTGVLIITAFTLYTVFYGLVRLIRRKAPEPLFHEVRQRLGRGIMLGLEFLVAADIIHTVAVDLSFRSVGVLAAILLIRTFLSFTLELELTGTWPWQQGKTPRPEGHTPA